MSKDPETKPLIKIQKNKIIKFQNPNINEITNY